MHKLATHQTQRLYEASGIAAGTEVLPPPLADKSPKAESTRQLYCALIYARHVECVALFMSAVDHKVRC